MPPTDDEDLADPVRPRGVDAAQLRRPARTRPARRRWARPTIRCPSATTVASSTASRGLRIADASLMPVVPRVNTNIPTIMIGERIGEWVREDLAPRLIGYPAQEQSRADAGDHSPSR